MYLVPPNFIPSPPLSMHPIILDGGLLARRRLAEVTDRVRRLRSQINFVPTLATILVGDDPSSRIYVAMKERTCKSVGMDSLAIRLPEATTTEQLIECIHGLNRRQNVCGILLQHPVPRHIDERQCFDAIALSKDVDGVTAAGYGLMALGGKAFGSATPQGIMTLLEHYKVPLVGKRAVVIGRSPILGKPMQAMLMNANATVTVCHSHTDQVPDRVREADIVVAALGRPGYVKAEWITPGAVLVDAGYHKVTRPGEGTFQIGDIDPEAFKKASAYTPVPGGVGPMTIATLIEQTLLSAESRLAN